MRLLTDRKATYYFHRRAGVNLVPRFFNSICFGRSVWNWNCFVLLENLSFDQRKVQLTNVERKGHLLEERNLLAQGKIMFRKGIYDLVLKKEFWWTIALLSKVLIWKLTMRTNNTVISFKITWVDLICSTLFIMHLANVTFWAHFVQWIL